jgi:hypothetical protein
MTTQNRAGLRVALGGADAMSNDGPQGLITRELPTIF